jgi:hypothetical protein
VRPRRRQDEWYDRALDLIPSFVAERGAVVWPEVEANLAEGTWIAVHRPGVGYTHIQPHVLGRARKALVADGTLIEDPVRLNGRDVTAFLDGPGLAGRRTRQIQDTAGAKRRLYRSFLGWTGRSELCGHVAERVVEATIESLAGTELWLTPEHRHGRVDRLLEREVVGGPLDAAGFVPVNTTNPGAGWTPFAIEVKNLRSWIYPWSHEVWDLLAKLGNFPDVVPILIARRIHPITFRMFKDVGALGVRGSTTVVRRAGWRSLD